MNNGAKERNSINSFYLKYRDVILFNKNLIFSGTCAFFTAALVTQLYLQFDKNNLSNSIIALATEYGVYIPLFAFLFYRDNRLKYNDPQTGKRDSKRIRGDIRKLFAAFSVSEIIYSDQSFYPLSTPSARGTTISGFYDKLLNCLGNISPVSQCIDKGCQVV
jgi:hypothetical protein